MANTNSLITPSQREHHKRNSHKDVDPSDPYNFDVRFVSNQLLQFDDALKEIQEGCKRTCWLWFVLPSGPHLNKLRQEVGSATNQHFALRSDEEVLAYLKFPARKGIHLRTNYHRMVLAILKQLESPPEPTTMLRLFGYLDAPKVESSIRLFLKVLASTTTLTTTTTNHPRLELLSMENDNNDNDSDDHQDDDDDDFKELATACQKVLDLILLEKQQREIIHVVRTANKRKQYRHVMTL